MVCCSQEVPEAPELTASTQGERESVWLISWRAASLPIHSSESLAPLPGRNLFSGYQVSCPCVQLRLPHAYAEEMAGD